MAALVALAIGWRHSTTTRRMSAHADEHVSMPWQVGDAGQTLDDLFWLKEKESGTCSRDHLGQTCEEPVQATA